MATESSPLAASFGASPTKKSTRSSFIDVYDEEDKVAVAGSSSINRFAAVLNLVNVIVGSGIVGLSYVVKAAGVVPFLIFMCVSGGLAFQTLQFLVAATQFTAGQKSYEAVGKTALGQVGVVLTAVAIILQNFGGMTSYLILIRDAGPPVLKLMGLEGMKVQTLQVIVTGLFCYPLCLLKDLSMLAYTCFFALCVFTLIMCTASGYFASGDGYYAPSTGADNANWTSFDASSAFKEFPTIIFAFVCHTACLPIYSQLKTVSEGLSKERMGHVNASSITIASILYIVTGVAGYLTYTSQTKTTLLLNFRHCPDPPKTGPLVCSDDSNYISLLNGMFAVAVLLGYPSVHFPTRRAVIALVWGVDKQFNWLVHCGVATCLVGMTLTLALNVKDVQKAFSWTGAIASPLIVYILPSFYYQHLLGKVENVSVLSPKRLWPIFVMCFGVVFMVICLSIKIHALWD